jgi:type I restriction enzyme M protein
MATKKEIQSEINGILWKACDTFRGAVDPSEYKNYILVMLFLKYVSDVWQDHYEKVKAEYGDDEERILRRLKRERFVLPPSCTFQALYGQRNAANLGEVINEALDAVEEANKEKLEGVFRNIDFNSEASLGQTRERNTRLKSLLEDFNDPRLDLRPSRVGQLDVIGDAYEYLIGKFAAGAGKKAGEFYTPPEVSELLARLMDPQDGEEVCDPACGSGSLLLKCGRLIRERSGMRRYALYGQEAIGSTWALAKMNMFLHGEDNHRIEWGDTIRNPKLLAGDTRLRRFDVVVANPPFSLDKWGHESVENDRFGRFRRGVPPRAKGDFAFILHMVETMNPRTGRMAVVMPHGVLFRGGAEGAIRRKLVEENLLDAVIGIPEKLFYGTSIPGAVLVFRKNKADDKVLFVDASSGFQAGKNQNLLRETDLERILTTYAARHAVEKYASLVTPADIAEHDYNLNVARYVDSTRAALDIDLDALRRERMELKKEWVGIEEEIAGYLKELGYD